MHARQAIRAAVVSAVTGLTTTGLRVGSTRVYPFQDLPALNVYVESESVVEQPAMGDDEQLRELALIIEARSKAGAAVSDELELICEEVETAVKANSAVQGAVKYVDLDEVSIQTDDEVEKVAGVATMRWTVGYATSATDPSMVL